MNFKNSQTRENLMRAFAGESQARNRYTFAASQARTQKLHVIQEAFIYTASQEQAHAKVFYDLLSEEAGNDVTVDGTYPIDISQSLQELLEMARNNEYKEHDEVYSSFAQIAKDEGFLKISNTFDLIAKVEKTHGERFERLARLMRENELFKNEAPITWVCLNCGHIHTGINAPEGCPICNHDKGYFLSYMSNIHTF